MLPYYILLPIQYFHFAHLLSLLCIIFSGLSAMSIDNDIIGEPDIECLDQEIRVWVKTRKTFTGRIYAKGKSEDPACSKDNFGKDRTKKPHFELPLGMCGMKSLRSFDPRGMYYGVTLVISFHTLFITKVDQAFHVKCFFEEANRGLTAELGVSMLPTTEVNARHSIMGCSYSIHRSSILDLDAGRPAGTAIQFAKVGDKVLHQWHCEDPMFGVLINNCYVTDGVNKKAQVIDAHGCPVDPILITGIRYSADLQRAYAESQVFKFADRPGVWFFCQIQMCMKKEGMCDGITPPTCATTTRPLIDGHSSGDRYHHGAKGLHTENNGEENSVAERTRVTEVIPTGTENELGGSNGASVLKPVRVSTDKIPSEYENYAGDSVGQTNIDRQDGTTQSNFNEADMRSERSQTRRPLRQPPKQQEHTKSSDGYAQIQSPSAIEYDANEDDASKSAAIFGPGLSPSDSGLLGPGHDFSISNNENNSGSKGTERVLPSRGRDVSGLQVQPPFDASNHQQKSSEQQRKIKMRQEASVNFETIDDLRPSGPPGTNFSADKSEPTTRTTVGESPSSNKATTTQQPNGSKKDYVEYDDAENDNEDVTVPPNLVNLLAKLPPDEINADNLQKMFRDSVADRRALLNGFDALINKMRREESGDENLWAHQKARRLFAPDATATPNLMLPVPANASPFVISAPTFGRRFSGTKNIPMSSALHLPTSKMVPGKKIDTINVLWDSAPDLQQNRMARDSPLPYTSLKKSESAPINENLNKNDSSKENYTLKKMSSSIDKNTSIGNLPTTLKQPAEFKDANKFTYSHKHLTLRHSSDILSGEVLGTDKPNDPPMIAGQLLIYDLDETPPEEKHSDSSLESIATIPEQSLYENGAGCALTKQGLFLLATSLSSLISVLVIVVVALIVKTRNTVKRERNMISKQDPSCLRSQVATLKEPLKMKNSCGEVHWPSSSNPCTNSPLSFSVELEQEKQYSQASSFSIQTENPIYISSQYKSSKNSNLYS